LIVLTYVKIVNYCSVPKPIQDLIEIWDLGIITVLHWDLMSRDLSFCVWRFRIWHVRFDLSLAHHTDYVPWTQWYSHLQAR